jgi:hypothetical protein
MIFYDAPYSMKSGATEALISPEKLRLGAPDE